jgi:predicted acyl esterase
MRIAGAAVLALLLLAAAAIWQFRASLDAGERARDESVLRRVADAYQVLYLDPLQPVDDAYRATEIKKTPQTEEALRVAQKVANDRREILKEEASITGSPTVISFVANRWKQGDVFTKLSRDSHYALVASERGKSGPNPPGTA